MTVQVLKSDAARTHWRKLLDAARAGSDTVIEHYDTPTAVVIPFADYEALQDELDDLRAARRAREAVAAWESDPSLGRPYEDFRAELIAEDLLDE